MLPPGTLPGTSSSLSDRISRDPRFANMDWATAAQALQAEDAAKLATSQRRWGVADKVATAAATIPIGMAAGSGLSALFSGGGGPAAAPSIFTGSAGGGGGYGSLFGGTGQFLGSGAAATVPKVAAAGAGLGSRLGSFFANPAVNFGINAATSIYGQHSANKSAAQARADVLAGNAQALALEREQMEAYIRNADLDRADAKAANDALNELKRRELDAAEEQRQFDREQYQARETRLAPYRQISQQAASRLAAMWGLQ